ncbi:hypothetical protein BJV82DRAFT_599790 [Fennellomyces sp. T-0311]|nr:hypothetical protein BJV82DRAFT_599790 [Fennellomyces sp. T-0311]
MSFFKSTYNKVISNLTFYGLLAPNDTDSNLFDTEQQRQRKRWQLELAKYGDRNQVRLSATSAQFYLTLGQIYKDQHNFVEALEVYRQGIASARSSDAHCTRLKKETQVVLVTLAKYNKQLSRVPYEVWEQVIQHLKFKDYAGFACAFNAWSGIIFNTPGFWETFCSNNGIQVYESGRSTELRINLKIVGRSEVKEKLLILSSWRENIFQKLSTFLRIHGTEDTADTFIVALHIGYDYKYGLVDSEALTQLLQYITPSFKEVVLDGPWFHVQDIISTFESCARVERLSFILVDMDYDEGFSMAMRDIMYSHLTYLVLSFIVSKRRSWDDRGFEHLYSVISMLRRCPNLRHLILANAPPLRPFQTECAREALESCPRLETLAISGAKAHPTYLVDDIDYHERRSFNSKPRAIKGLRALIHYAEYYAAGYSDIGVAFDKFHGSLEFLKVLYDNKWINTRVLSILASKGMPFLREFHLHASQLSMISQAEPAIDKVLILLFSRCPYLEVITIDCGNLQLAADPRANDELLVLIAKSCTLLTHLTLSSQHIYEDKAMLKFAAAVGTSFKYICTRMTIPAATTIAKNTPQFANCLKMSYRNFTTVLKAI